MNFYSKYIEECAGMVCPFDNFLEEDVEKFQWGESHEVALKNVEKKFNTRENVDIHRYEKIVYPNNGCVRIRDICNFVTKR